MGEVKSQFSYTTLGYVILLISMFSVGTISSYFSSWNYTIVLLVLSSVLLLLINIRNIKLTNISLAWLIVVIICLFASINTMNFRDFTFYIFSGILVVVSFSVSAKSLYKCFPIIILGALVSALGIFIQFVFPSFYDKYIFRLFYGVYSEGIIRQYYRHRMYTGFTSEASISAQFMVVGIAGIYSIYHRLTKYRKLAWIVGIVLFFGVVLTGKRSALLFSSASLIYTFLVSSQKGKKSNRVLKIILLTIIAAIALYFFLPEFISQSSSRNSIVRIFEYLNEDRDLTNGRVAIWLNAIKAFNSSPILGKGWSWFAGEYGFGAHNIYLQLLCECGILGGSIVIFILGWLYFKCHQCMKVAVASDDSERFAISKFCFFTQTYILMYGLTGNPIYNYSFFLWYAFSLCILSYLNVKNGTVRYSIDRNGEV